DAIGSENRAVNSRISATKTRIAKRDGDEVMKWRTKCHRVRMLARDEVDQSSLDIRPPRSRMHKARRRARRAFVMVLRPWGDYPDHHDGHLRRDRRRHEARHPPAPAATVHRR